MENLPASSIINLPRKLGQVEANKRRSAARIAHHRGCLLFQSSRKENILNKQGEFKRLRGRRVERYEYTGRRVVVQQSSCRGLSGPLALGPLGKSSRITPATYISVRGPRRTGRDLYGPLAMQSARISNFRASCLLFPRAKLVRHRPIAGIGLNCR